jgi:hypothetical protein
MMVPYHVYQAAQEAEEFDFLTNQYMGPEDQPSSSLTDDNDISQEQQQKSPPSK